MGASLSVTSKEAEEFRSLITSGGSAQQIGVALTKSKGLVDYKLCKSSGDRACHLAARHDRGDVVEAVVAAVRSAESK